MSTNLFAISNTSLAKHNSKKDWDFLLKQLKELKIPNAGNYDADNVYYEDNDPWMYNIEEVIEEDDIYHVHFWGPTMYHISLYEDICIIGTFYKYGKLYEYYNDKFRDEMYSIMNIFGGSELIYLADNGCKHLSYFFEELALENTPYQTIKNEMVATLGDPIRKAKNLTDKEHLYSRINEFFLERFEDLKLKNNKK